MQSDAHEVSPWLQWRHMSVSDNRQLECLFISLLSYKSRNTKALYFLALCEGVHQASMDYHSPNKVWRAFPGHDVIILRNFNITVCRRQKNWSECHQLITLPAYDFVGSNETYSYLYKREQNGERHAWWVIRSQNEIGFWYDCLLNSSNLSYHCNHFLANLL